ncbi:hypothetical protein FRC01_013620, partial [Tulasnella sp. 417]
QAVQTGLTNLTSPAVDTSTNRPDLKASGPVGAPAHPSSATAGLGGTIQGGLNSLADSARSAVGSLAPAQKPAGPEDPAHVVGLLPAPSASDSKREGEQSSSELQLKSGGAMINTSPPTDLHPSQSDENANVAPRSYTTPSGPSPVDGVPAGETRANLETAHAGNYAYTNLPNKEGNVIDPHAGEPKAGYIDQAKVAMSSVAANPMGSLAGALAAVGLGGAAGATAVTAEQKDKAVKEQEPVEEIDMSTAGKSEKSPAPKGDNFLAPEGIVGSRIPIDEDVQAAVAKAEGRAYPEENGPTVDDINAAAKKEHDAAAEVGGRPTGPIHTSSNPIQTTTNTYESKAAVATSPATEVGETGHREHPEAAGKTHVADGFKDTIKSAAQQMKPGSKKDEDKPAITTTTNTQEKAAPATSPATSVEARTNPLDDKTTGATSVPAPAPAPAPASQAFPTIDTESDGHTRGATDTTSTTATTGSTPTSPTKSHKRGPSLKDRIKGEMKVITGKLSRNEAKVVEGKALKSGGLSATSAANSPISPARK